MVRLGPGLVVLLRFPFSDLSSSKLRPAVVLAHAGGVDWVLCQVTSNPYGDAKKRGTIVRIRCLRSTLCRNHGWPRG